MLAEVGDIKRFAKARLATKPFHSDLKVIPVDETVTLGSPKFLPVPTLKKGEILKEGNVSPSINLSMVSSGRDEKWMCETSTPSQLLPLSRSVQTTLPTVLPGALPYPLFFIGSGTWSLQLTAALPPDRSVIRIQT